MQMASFSFSQTLSLPLSLSLSFTHSLTIPLKKDGYWPIFKTKPSLYSRWWRSAPQPAPSEFYFEQQHFFSSSFGPVSFLIRRSVGRAVGCTNFFFFSCFCILCNSLSLSLSFLFPLPPPSPVAVAVCVWIKVDSLLQPRDRSLIAP